MAMAPDNTTICTASADETLRFWKVFDGNPAC
jgi:WD40 repeat protein